MGNETGMVLSNEAMVKTLYTISLQVAVKENCKFSIPLVYFIGS